MVWVQASGNDSENSSTVPTGLQTGSPNAVSFATPKHGGQRTRTLDRPSFFALTAQGGQSRTVNGPSLDDVTQRLDRIESSLVSLASTVQGLVDKLELPRKKDLISDLGNLRIAAETVVSRETICSVLLVTVEGVPCYLCPICVKPQRVAAMRSNFYNHQKSSNCIVPDTCSEECLQHHLSIKVLYDCRTALLKSSEQPNVCTEEPTWSKILESANQVVDEMEEAEQGKYTLIRELPARNPHARLKPYENCPTVELAKTAAVNDLISKCQQPRQRKRPLTPTAFGFNSSSRPAKVSRTHESLPE